MHRELYFPPEILSSIFSFLTSRELIVVSSVCRAWYALSKERKHLILKATPSVNNLHDVVSNYPSLQTLELRFSNTHYIHPSFKHSLPDLTSNLASLSFQSTDATSPTLNETNGTSSILSSLHFLFPSSSPPLSNGLYVDELHRVASQFKGHAALQTLISDSEMVLPGALKSPNLRVLKISSAYSFRPPNHAPFEPELHSYLHHSQNICHLMNHLPKLEVLDISRPIFWRRSTALNRSELPIHRLRELTIRETSAWCLVNLSGFLKRGQAPNLTKFHLEVDLHLPRDFFHALGTGCKQLQELKLLHTNLAPEHLMHLGQSGLSQSLKTLSLHYVEAFFPHQQIPIYKPLLSYLTHALPNLESLEMIHCDWLNMDDFEWIPTTGQQHHSMKSLSLFDLGEHYLGDLNFLVSTFPELRSLKLHLDYSDFSDISPLLKLTQLSHVELRCREVTQRAQEFLGTPPLPFEFPGTQLTSLVFWVPPARSWLLQQCLFPCSSTLTSLVLNYPNTSFCNLICSQPWSLPNLRRLEIRALGSEGHKNGQALLSWLGRHAPKLRHVHLECLHYLSQPFDSSILSHFSTPQLVDLHIQGYSLSTDIFSILQRWQPSLQTLELCGPAFESMDVPLHTSLCEFLKHARRLSRLTLSVSDITLPSFANISPVIIGTTGFLLKERESVQKRRLYQCHLARLFPWIEEVSIWSKLACRDISNLM